MDSLPENTWLSANFCNRWSGRLVVDGKYVKVKGYDQKIPFIYGIDYLTHDIPVGLLAPSENEEAYYKFFVLLKTCKYPFQIVIADDNGAVRPALAKVFPTVRTQLCQRPRILSQHFLWISNVRRPSFPNSINSIKYLSGCSDCSFFVSLAFTDLFIKVFF